MSMVSKITSGVYFYIPLFFIFYLSLQPGYGQNVAKHFTSSQQDNGILYFIFPQSGFTKKATKSRFVYDITYLNSSDSAILNFSYFAPEPQELDSIVFVGNQTRCSSGLKKMFVEAEKRQWHNRYSATVPFAELENFFREASPPQIILFSKGNALELNIAPKIWKQQSDIIGKIMTAIEHNR